jgi:hypothetical protein
VKREKRSTRNRLSMFLEEMGDLPSSPLASAGGVNPFAALPMPGEQQVSVRRKPPSAKEGEAGEEVDDQPELDSEPGESEEDRKAREMEEALLTANSICERVGRYRCRLCQKLFKGEPFVHKHIRLRHPTLFTDVDASLELVAMRDMLKEANEREATQQQELASLRCVLGVLRVGRVCVAFA